MSITDVLISDIFCSMWKLCVLGLRKYMTFTHILSSVFSCQNTFVKMLFAFLSWVRSLIVNISLNTEHCGSIYWQFYGNKFLFLWSRFDKNRRLCFPLTTLWWEWFYICWSHFEKYECVRFVDLSLLKNLWSWSRTDETKITLTYLSM